MISAIGYLASVGALFMWWPQSWRVVAHRHDARSLEGISPGAFSTAMVFNALLLTYGVGTDGVPVIVAGSVNFAMSSCIVAVLAWARMRA